MELPALEYTSLKFSPDGKLILVSTGENTILLLDSFSGEMVKTKTNQPIILVETRYQRIPK